MLTEEVSKNESVGAVPIGKLVRGTGSSVIFSAILIVLLAKKSGPVTLLLKSW